MTNPRHSCCVCEQGFAAEDLAVFGKDRVCADCKPAYVQRLKEGIDPKRGDTQGPPSGMAHLGGRDLCLPRPGVLPKRCIKCNSSDVGAPKRRSQLWFPLWVYFTLPLVPLFIVLALWKSRAVSFRYWLCARHERQRRIIMVTGYIVAFVSVLITILAGSKLGFFAALVFIFLAVRLGNTLWIKNVTPGLIRMRGACKEFMDSLQQQD